MTQSQRVHRILTEHFSDGTHNLRTGNMYADNITQSVTVSATDTYYKVPGGISGGKVNGFTFQNAKELLCAIPGWYVVIWSMSVNCATVGQEIEGAVMVGNTAQLNTTNHNTTGTAISKNITISGNGIIQLAIGDVVGLAVSNHTAVHNIVVEHVNLTLMKSN